MKPENTHIKSKGHSNRPSNRRAAVLESSASTSTTNALADDLKKIHPANIIGGSWVLRQWSLHEFHHGVVPECHGEHPIFELAAEMWAGRKTDDPFDLILDDYGKLLASVWNYLFPYHEGDAAEGKTVDADKALQSATNGLVLLAARKELERIGHNLGMRIVLASENPEQLPTPSLDPIKDLAKYCGR